MITSYIDAEDIVLSWLLTTSVADLVNDKIFLGMPTGYPNPSVILSRVGGSPTGVGDLPLDESRISFSIWGKNRPQAKIITKALVSECESMGMNGGYTATDGKLQAIEVISWSWAPDDKTARYIVDALVTTTGSIS